MKLENKNEDFVDKIRREQKEEPAYKLLEEAYMRGYFDNPLKQKFRDRVKTYLETGILTR